MIRIGLTGGLGNQLFIYALYRSLEEKGKNVSLDTSWYLYSDAPIASMFHLDKFNCKFECYHVPKVVDRIRQSLTRHGKDTFLIRANLWKKYKEKIPGVFDENVLCVDNCYLEGFWQSEKYFIDISDKLRSELIYDGDLSTQNKKYLSAITSTNSVSLHVRRGDYLNNNSLYGNICTDQYYKKAIDFFSDESSNVTFFVFSDDIMWCKNELLNGFKNVVYVEGNNGAESYFDMILMSKCKNHIIANSSFSWWGAWLSGNKGITVAPSRWLNNSPTTDIWCENWIRI